MVSTQTQEEKDEFFAHLDTLGESEDDGDVPTDDDVKIIKEVKLKPTPNVTEQQCLPAPRTRTLKSVPNDQVSKSEVSKAVSTSNSVSTSRSKVAEGRQQARKSKAKDHIELVPEADRLFAGFSFFFIPNDDIIKARKMRIRTSISYGAVWARNFGPHVTHVIVDYRLDFAEASKALPKERPLTNVILVRDTWMIDSIRFQSVQRPTESRFIVKGTPEIVYTSTLLKEKPPSNDANMVSMKRKLEECVEPPQKKPSTEQVDELDKIVHEVQNSSHWPWEKESFDDSVADDSTDESGLEENFTLSKSTIREPGLKNAGFQCMEKNDGSNDNPNVRTIEMLQKMATYYERTGDQWRTMAYRKAIGALKKQTILIRTKKEALAIPQIGTRLADKIEEIVTTNRLKSLERAQDDPTAQVLQLFMGIYGVGLVQANKWIGQGHRTLEDLTKNAKLNRNQKLGIEHYDDFQQRIPRSEVAEHVQVVQKALHKVDARLDAIVSGSYRRGSSDSSDIDILITKRDATIEVIRTLVMDSVVPSLHRAGFLQVALASSTARDSGSKWHGASCLPGSKVWRRIDLLFVPWSELGAALIYFTGNDIFNRSLRLLASRKGMRLNQHGLFTDVMRGTGRSKVTDGKLLEGHSEVKIFDILGVPWRPPEHRKC